MPLSTETILPLQRSWPSLRLPALAFHWKTPPSMSPPIATGSDRQPFDANAAAPKGKSWSRLQVTFWTAADHPQSLQKKFKAASKRKPRGCNECRALPWCSYLWLATQAFRFCFGTRLTGGRRLTRCSSPAVFCRQVTRESKHRPNIGPRDVADFPSGTRNLLLCSTSYLLLIIIYI